MQWVHRRTLNANDLREAREKDDLFQRPYLTWVPEDLRAQTVDPSSLPDRKPKRRRRILMMTSTYLTGGAEMFAVNVARILAPVHDVFLWAQRPGNYTIQGDLPIYEGDPVHLAQRLKVDLVIYNNGGAFWYESRFKAETSIPTVLCQHGMVQWTLNQFKGCEWCLGTIDALWAFSRVCGAMKHLLGITAKAHEMHCPVDDTNFPFRRRRWKPPFQVGYVGRVSPEKNLPNLVRLWKRLHDQLGDQVHFHFVGGLDPTNHDSEYLSWLGPVLRGAKAMPEWLELMGAGALTDHGHSSPARVAAIVRKLHLLTLTSDFEGEPVVFTEAMASGCLCSFRDVGEVGEQLRGHGLLTTPRTLKTDDRELDEMAAGIVDLLSRPRACAARARKGREVYEARHAPENWSANFERMMEDVLRCAKAKGRQRPSTHS